MHTINDEDRPQVMQIQSDSALSVDFYPFTNTQDSTMEKDNTAMSIEETSANNVDAEDIADPFSSLAVEPLVNRTYSYMEEHVDPNDNFINRNLENDAEQPKIWADAEALSSPEDSEEDCATLKYDLRPSRGVQMSTFVDDDETDDYDPREELRKTRDRRDRAKVDRQSKRLQRSTNPDDFDDLQTNCHSIQEYEPECITLTFKEAHSPLRVREILQNLSSDDDSDGDERPAGFRKLRYRETHEETPNDLTGHPQARGCRNCLKLGLRCHLLDDETAWPCSGCKESLDQCELINEPKFKQDCDSCKDRKLNCSFASSYKNAGPCKNCQDANQTCKTGPSIDQIPSRIRYVKASNDNERTEGHEDDEGGEMNNVENGYRWTPSEQRVIEPPKPKKIWTCKQCRGARRFCSLSTDHTNDTCKTCEAHDLDCQKEFVIRDAPLTPAESAALKNVTPVIPIVTRAARTVSKRKVPSSFTPNPSLDLKRPRTGEAPSSASAKLKPERKDIYEPFNLKTKFSHPIEFFSKPDPNDFDSACDFCDGSAFSFFGLEGIKTVVQWAESENGQLVLHEVSGGHREKGAETTKMCHPCTMARAHILDCKFHHIRLLTSEKPTDEQVKDALGALNRGWIRSQDRWCAVCPALATAECQASGTKFESYGPGKWCGLLLCEQCRSELARNYGGQFSKMLNDLKDRKTEGRPLGLRADSVFLKRENGLLFNFMFPRDKRRK